MVIGELQGDLLLPKAGERGTDQSEAGFIIFVEPVIVLIKGKVRLTEQLLGS